MTHAQHDLVSEGLDLVNFEQQRCICKLRTHRFSWEFDKEPLAGGNKNDTREGRTLSQTLDSTHVFFP